MNQTTERKIHQGRNVRRFREMRNLTQDGLAMELGEDWNQKKVSLLEGKEEIEPPILEQVSKALKMPVEAFTNLDDESAINIISSTLHDTSIANNNYNPTFNFNVGDKWVEALEEIKKLNAEKVELYERMISERNELIEELKKLRH